MSTEDLMNPRFSVTIDYPCGMWKKGDIIPTYESAMGYAVKIDGVSEKICLKDYPEIFKQMQWWQSREKDELPKYLKTKAGNSVREVKDYIYFEMVEFVGGAKKKIKHWLPATEQEFLTHIHNKTTVSTNI